MVFGIPDEALMGAVGAIVLLVIGLKVMGGKKPEPLGHETPEPEAEGVPAKKHTELEDLIEKSGSPDLPNAETIEEEEEAGMSVQTNSLEVLMAKPIDAAPSLGNELNTDVSGGLDLVKFEESPAIKPVGILPKEMKDPVGLPKPTEKPLPKKAHDLVKLHEQFGEEFDIDEMGDIVAIPEERPRYEAPADLKEKAEKETSRGRPVRLYDQPVKERKENLKRYCMLQYDKGETPKKVENLLRVKGTNRTESKQLSFKMYRIWIEKREPLIREIKETRDMIKRVEYKFLKRKIDGVARNKMINESNEKIAMLESKLKSSEDYFD